MEQQEKEFLNDRKERKRKTPDERRTPEQSKDKIKHQSEENSRTFQWNG